MIVSKNVTFTDTHIAQVPIKDYAHFSACIKGPKDLSDEAIIQRLGAKFASWASAALPLLINRGSFVMTIATEKTDFLFPSKDLCNHLIHCVIYSEQELPEQFKTAEQ